MDQVPKVKTVDSVKLEAPCYCSEWSQDSQTDSEKARTIPSFQQLTTTFNGSGPIEAAPSLSMIGTKDVLHGVLECLDCDKDAYDVATSLMETEGELQDLLDNTTLLNLPDIFTDVVTPAQCESHSDSCSENAAALVPSVSWELFVDNEKSNSDEISESLHPASGPKNYNQRDILLHHPLYPLLNDILIHETQDPMKNISPDNTATSVSFCDFPEADEVMFNTLVVANTLFEDKQMKKVMKDIDNECESISSRMSTFCQDLLTKSPKKTNESCTQTKHHDHGSYHGYCDTVPDLEGQKEDSETTCTNRVPDKENSSINNNKIKEQTNTSIKASNKNDPKLKSVHKKKRTHIPLHITKQLREWLLLHAHHPYPDDDEKDELCLQTGLSHSQLNNWFINARRRILAPMRLHNNVQTSGK